MHEQATVTIDMIDLEYAISVANDEIAAELGRIVPDDRRAFNTAWLRLYHSLSVDEVRARLDGCSYTDALEDAFQEMTVPGNRAIEEYARPGPAA